MSVPPEAMARAPMADAVQQGIVAQGGQPAGAPPAGPGVSRGQPQIPYEQVFDNISKIVDGEEGLEPIHEQLMQMLVKGAAAPAEALSNATLAVGELVFQDAQEKGVTLSDDQLMAAAMDTITSLDELAAEAGIFEASDEDLQEAMTLTLQGWMQAHPELIDQEGMQQSLANMDPEMVSEAQEMYGADTSAQPPAQGGPATAPEGGLING